MRGSVWGVGQLVPLPGTGHQKPGRFFAFAVSEQNFTFATSSLASGAGELGRH